MKLLVIAEGPHELGGALETLVRRLTGIVGEFDVLKVSDRQLRVHPGKGRGYFKKAIRCLLFAAEHGYDGLVLLIDQDDRPERKRQLSDAQEDIRLGALPRAMGVAVRTFDAWMLADEQALTSVLGYQVQRQPDPETIHQPKNKCAELLNDSNASLKLASLYVELAKIVDLSVLAERCPQGFDPFARRSRNMARQLSG